MKASVIAKVYTKGESKNATVKSLKRGVEYIDAYYSAVDMAKMLLFTGWYCVSYSNPDALTHSDFENGVKFENYSNEVLILTLKATKK